ncbi:MAG: beta-ketoacyl synthase N-terminal-like domain-containing protein, partial [Candidatus Aminicenantes bacterium]
MDNHNPLADTKEKQGVKNMEVPFTSLSEVLMNSAKSDRGITFIESKNNEDFMSYKELYDQAAYVLYNLQKSGLKPGDELVFQFQYDKNFVITFWASILGKIIPVPINFGLSDEIMLRLSNVWKILNHPFVITDFPGFEDIIDTFEPHIDNIDIISDLQSRIIYYDDVNVTDKKAASIPSELNDIAFIQYSSGSTGKPKGVINTHENIIFNLQYCTEFFKMSKNDRTLSWMPLTHDMGLIFFHLFPLYNRAQQVLIPPVVFITFPWLWMTKASDHQITISGSTNTGFKYYLDHFDEKTLLNKSLRHLKYMLIGAEPISFHVCQRFVQTLSRYQFSQKAIQPCYGLAEATLGVSSIPITDEISEHIVHRHYLDVGDQVKWIDPQNENALSFVDLGIFTFTSIKVTNEAGQELPEKYVGHVKIKGPCVTRGYYNDPIATGKAIGKDGWLDTGDLGFIYNQRLVIVGRFKEIIIINGQNFYPHDLERVAEEVEGIEPGKCVITSVLNSKRHSEEVLSFIVFKKDIQDMKEFVSLAARLKMHFIDKIGIEVNQFIPIDKIPITTSGKIQRYKLKERYLSSEFTEDIEELISLRRQLKPVQRNLSKSEVQEILLNICKDVLQVDQININDNFFDLGGSSSSALRVRVRLEEALGKDLDDIALFKYPNVNALADYLSTGEPGITSSDQPGEKLAAFINQRRTIQQRIKKNLIIKRGAHDDRNGGEIAIIAMAGRFPGAMNIEQLWNNLKYGVESISFFSDEELNECGVPSRVLKDSNYIKAKGVLQDIDYFDAAFFGYAPLEAEKMDPQVRLFHECSWLALEDAGYDPGSYNGLIGVYVGASPNPYWTLSLPSSAGIMDTAQQFIDAPIVEKDFMTTRLSYKLKLTGPSFYLYTACSTSLVAIDLACQGLLLGKCDMALAGGVSLWLPSKNGYLYDEGMIFSRDGHNRTFDEQSSGTVFSDGAGIVLLKRLEDALDDGDNIYAIIKGSAINNDGDRKIGYTAPAVEGQAEVIKTALEIAGVEPESIGYLEAHGTATNLGDSIEIDALNLAFGSDKKRYCAIGSIKSNIGHANAAAGVAGFIKAVLSLKHRQIFPSLNFHRANPKINFEKTPFYVNTSLTEWKPGDYPLRAGVSSFGIGGTNAHVVLEEAPIVRGAVPKTSLPYQLQEYQLILLSAKTLPALDRMTENLAEYLKKNPSINLADAAYTLQRGRAAFEYRRMCVGAAVSEIVEALAPGSYKSEKVKTYRAKAENLPVVFLFSGQGSQYVNMGQELYEKEPVFREELDHCFEILNGLMDDDIKEILYPSSVPSVPSVSSVAESPPGTCNLHLSPDINQTEIAQPLLFAFEYALTRLLMRWGIKPDA